MGILRRLAEFVLDDGAFAHFGDREFDEFVVLADLLGEDVLFFERGLHDLAVDQVVGNGIYSEHALPDGIFVRVGDAHIGLIRPVGFEDLDTGSVIAREADFPVDLVEEAVLLVEVDGGGIGVFVIARHAEFFGRNFSEPVIGGLGVQSDARKCRYERQQGGFFHGGAFLVMSS